MEVLEFCPKQLHPKIPAHAARTLKVIHVDSIDHFKVNCGEATVLRKKMNSLTLERSYPRHALWDMMGT